MRNILIAVITILAVSSITWATGTLTRDKNGVAIQGLAPNRLTLRNDSKTGTKVFQSISTATFAAVRVTCTDGTGNTKPCRAYPNAGTTYISIPTGERTILLDDASTTSIKFTNMSGASATTVFNTERM